MKYVIEQTENDEKKQRILLLELEIDDELLILFSAMKQNDINEIKQTKSKLQKLVCQIKTLKRSN